MSSDLSRRPNDVPFRMVGEGLSQTFKCGQCQQHKAMVGRRMMLVKKGPMRGLRDHVCLDCQKANAK